MVFIRQASLPDAGQIAKVHVESWKSTYKDIVVQEDLNHVLSYEKRKVLWETVLKSNSNDKILYVAESEDQKIVGFISGGTERSKKFNYDGEIYAIYILEDYQGMGIGKMLLDAFKKEAEEKGHQSILVWVLTANPSKKFYERFGAKPIEADEITIGDGTYEETAYGWENILSIRE
ncbi:ribosomal protein S18 acetylase RimI-like enzyme [Salirhabdus euzebyi]|uniref:Ribosomal protein S18 acetylase RimI-like enzyme n=1 Tax=Salirhabdus euzebyi TaxID=394506 RepID=A0A841Q8P0_9BACI|nr:GNAT family N-acetyltransferase [Salirhabdus euzebyi]MBB6454642.1 ribosomal protein S18 acetylase RimI-like enzyme [Salirhabdus euzebyi]